MLLAKMGQKYVTYITCKNAEKDTRMAHIVIRASIGGRSAADGFSRARAPVPVLQAPADRAA